MLNHSLSVVIPNYNGQALLESNLEFLIDEVKKTISDFEFIISDDASTDDSVNWIQDHFPFIKIITTDRNSGFSRNANRGIHAASKDLILVVNTDIQVKENFLKPLLRYFDQEQTFAVSCRLEGFQQELQDGGKWPVYGFTGIRSTKDFILKDISANEDVYTWFCSAACCIYDSKKLKLLGGFDEIYSPFYFEDADLCFRAWCMGWSSFYENQSVCIHPNSITIKSHHSQLKIKKIANRNKLILNFRFLSGLERASFIFILIIKLLFAWMGKLWFYESFLDFIKLRKNIRMANQKFYELMPRSNLKETKILILQSINNKPLDLF